MATRIMAAFYKVKLDQIRPQRGPPNFNQYTFTAEECVFPYDKIDRVPAYLYNYANSTDEAKRGSDEYVYPEGYTTEQQEMPSLAGGSSGGNPALFETAYKVLATITNTGDRDGMQVAQLYVGYPQDGKFPTPPRQLRGFEKVALKKGECEAVEFDIRHKDLTVWDPESSSWIVQRGKYQL